MFSGAVSFCTRAALTTCSLIFAPWNLKPTNVQHFSASWTFVLRELKDPKICSIFVLQEAGSPILQHLCAQRFVNLKCRLDAAFIWQRFLHELRTLEAQQRFFSYRAILAAIVSRNSFVLVFYGVSHNYRAIRCKMGYRTDMPVWN